MNATRPKSKPGKKRNKAKARERKAELLKALDEAIQAAKGKKPAKAATPKAPAKPKTAKPKAKKAEPKAKKEAKEPEKTTSTKKEEEKNA